MQDIKDLAKLSYDRTLAQKNLEEKQLSRLLLAYSGGLYKVNSELLNLLNLFADQAEIVILDSNNIPRKVIPTELLDLAKQRYQEVLTDWRTEYDNLNKIRIVNHVLE